MNKPKIFISHSCKDIEISGGVPFAVETDERRRRLKFVKLVRDRLEEKLRDRFEVLLDRELLDPGDRWRTKLLHWLGVCDGAVILLSEDSIESKWVLQEATICTWRKWLRDSFVLVPVIIGDIFKKLPERGFAPLQLDEIQAARLNAASELNEANAELLAGQVAEGFAGLALTADDNEIQRWVEDVAVRLKGIDETILKRACNPLGILDEDWAHFPDRPIMVAHHLLFTSLQAAREALVNLKPGFTDKGAFAAVVELVLPIWVHAEAASGIVASHPTQAAASRSFALNTNQFDTARDYLQRAFCCPSWWNTRCLSFNEPLGEGQEVEAFERIHQHIATTLGVSGTTAPEIIRGLVEAYPLFVVMGEQVPLTPEFKILLADSEELQTITCLQLAGPHFENAPDPSSIIRLLPEIRREDEDQALINKILLRNLAG